VEIFVYDRNFHFAVFEIEHSFIVDWVEGGMCYRAKLLFAIGKEPSVKRAQNCGFPPKLLVCNPSNTQSMSYI
jgi:hypothetical protein